MKLVSIILPLYRSERYIRETLRSVQAQTYPHWELVIVDDGSPDQSAEICCSFGDPRMRIFRRKNTGSCRARNFGITEARGELIGFIDHDDLWLPTKLERHVEHLKRRPQVGVSYGPSVFIDEHGKSIGLYQTPKLKNVSTRDVLLRCPIGNGSVPLIPREVLEQTKFYENRDGVQEVMYFDDGAVGWEDGELWFRIAYQTTWLLEGIPDCLTYYRILRDGIAGNPEKKQQGFEAGLERARRYAPEYIAKHGPAARAYHLRYMARRLILAGDGQGARKYVNRALRAFPGMLIEEPARTLLTMGGAYALDVLPQPFYSWLKQRAIAGTRAFQRRRIQVS